MISEKNDIWINLIYEIRKKIKEEASKAGIDEKEIENDVFEGDAGDICSTLAFKVAKKLKKNPMEIAIELAKNIGEIHYIKEIKAEKGFINFYIDRKKFAAAVFKEYTKECEGLDIGKNKKVIIEFPSVNPNKPWHIGHLRNALIGDFISNVYAYCGYDVEREDYIDDMGLQIVETVWGYKKLGAEDKKVDKKYDYWLGEIYVKANELFKNYDAKDELTALLKNMEEKGEDAKLARSICEKCVEAQYETAFSYGIYHNVQIWESDIIAAKIFEKSMHILEEKGIAKKIYTGKYAGCTIIDFNSIKNLPKEFRGLKEQSKVLIRSNGTATYAAKDIAFHMWKFGLIDDPFLYKMAYQPNNMPIYISSQNGSRQGFGGAKEAINVIDIEQHYEQSIVKLVLNLLHSDAVLEHLAYNIVELKEAQLSGRKGTWFGYTADEFLEEAKKKAFALITDRFKIDDETKQKIAESVAKAAIKFEFLHMSPERKIVFVWNRALTFEGISGPYCQYMHARASKILEGRELPKFNDEVEVYSDNEFKLVKYISKLNYIIEKTCVEKRPSILVDYAGNLAALFGSFYESSPVLKAENKEKMDARLLLVLAFKNVIGKALELSGIDALTKM
ncbi:MAG: arginine--tRNA ligase [Candidatus Micrarchaeaceae archaeon]